MDHETSTLREHNRKKNLFFKRNERGKEKTPCVCTWAQTKRAIQHLQDEFQIENINKNYGHANVQASDKFVMRMRKRLTKRKMFRIFFFFFTQLMQPSSSTKNEFLPCEYCAILQSPRQSFIDTPLPPYARWGVTGLLLQCIPVMSHYVVFPYRISLMMREYCSLFQTG